MGVIGAAGFIGSHLCERLVASDHHVVGVDDLSSGSVANLAAVLGDEWFQLKTTDCRDPELPEVLAGVDVIVHLAARKIPRYGCRLETLSSNVEVTAAVSSAAVAAKAHVVFVSTSDVYGNTSSPMSETSPSVLGSSRSARWAYAISKLYGEHLVLGLAEKGSIRATVVRLFGCYGPRNHPSWWGGVPSAFIEALLDGDAMDIHGDGEQVRSLIYVDDAVEAIFRIIHRAAGTAEIVNVGHEEPISIVELAKIVQAALEIEGPLRARFVPYRSLPGNYEDVRVRVPDLAKARTLLGFQANTSLVQGLAPTIEWHRQRRQAAEVCV